MTLLTVVHKETLVMLRARRTASIVLVYLLLLGCAVLWNWPRDQVLTLAAVSSQRMAYAVALGHLILVLAILPGIAAGSVNFERRAGSLDLLHATRISPFVLVLGKWLGCILFVLVLLICSLPMVALGFALGTLDERFALEMYLHLSVTALWAGLLGLVVGSFVRSAYVCYMTTYAIVLILCGLPLIPPLLVPGYMPVLMRNFSPLASMLSLLEPDLWRFVELSSYEVNGLLVYLSFCAVTGLTAFCLAWHRLGAPDQPLAHRKQRVIDDRREIMRRKLSFPFYLIDPQRRRRFIGNWVNPVLAREMRSRMLGQASNFLRAFYGVLIVSFVVTIYAVFRTQAELVDSVRLLVVASQVICIGLLGPLLTAPAIARERELGSIDLLRLTSIGPVRLVLGEWLYSMLIAMFFLVATVPMWLVVHLMQRVAPDAIWRSISVILAALFCGIAAGLFASSLSRRTGVATATAYLANLAVLFGTLLPLGLLSSGSPSWRIRLLSVNPIVGAVQPVSLTLFRDFLGPSTWLQAVSFLLTISILFLLGAVWCTSRSYAMR